MPDLPLQFLNVSFPDPGDNLAFDEALLEQLDSAHVGSQSGGPQSAGPQSGVLRVWHPPTSMAVLGRASKLEIEVDIQACQKHQISIQRRCSGGATIVTGPGCLMYALVLPIQRHPEVAQIDSAHQLVLGRLQQALQQIGVAVTLKGTSDLVVGDKKFSGNSLRCKRKAILYHGTLLLGFPLEIISAALPHPPREPEYRQGRSHDQFVMNLPDLAEDDLIKALCNVWNAVPTSTPDLPHFEKLREKYRSEKWITTGRQ